MFRLVIAICGIGCMLASSIMMCKNTDRQYNEMKRQAEETLNSYYNNKGMSKYF